MDPTPAESPWDLTVEANKCNHLVALVRDSGLAVWKKLNLFVGFVLILIVIFIRHYFGLDFIIILNESLSNVNDHHLCDRIGTKHHSDSSVLISLHISLFSPLLITCVVIMVFQLNEIRKDYTFLKLCYNYVDITSVY